MSLAEVTIAAVAVLDAAEDRTIAVAEAGVAYDHAGVEARLVAAGCLEEADDPIALVALSLTLALLRALPVPTTYGVLRERLLADLRIRGERLPAFLSVAA